MVVKKQVIVEKLKQLDTILQELTLYREKSSAEIEASLSLRWAVEGGLIAAARQVFEIADHILGGHFAIYPESYEESLLLLRVNNVVPVELYERMRGLGGFRNILVHEYARVDIAELGRGLAQAFEVFPAFSAAIQEWMETLPNNRPCA
ncbi:MAG: DUF86 domain-containing protein [Chloroflexi bacterium]|nr:DUF86 domain-containing protein [Chloroflexota bacterium]